VEKALSGPSYARLAKMQARDRRRGLGLQKETSRDSSLVKLFDRF
jgi:hypothetical protein